jgi:hypothetical protein
MLDRGARTATLRQAQRERCGCVGADSPFVPRRERLAKFLRTRILIGALGRSGGSGDDAVGAVGAKE